MGRRAGLGTAVVALAVAVSAHAGGPPVLHEYVKPPEGGGRGGRIVDPRARPGVEPDPGVTPGNPSAIRQGDRLLAEPPKSLDRGDGEVVHGMGRFAADRDTQARPDYQTQADSTLHYSEVFNPSVVPFKRMSALDGVQRDYTLYVYDAGKQPLEVGGETSADRDLFWGSLLVHLEPGVDVPLPSVAPDMRVLSYEVAPQAELVFSKDGAGNFFVRTDDPEARGEYRLVFLTDAAAGYFGAPVPGGYTVGDVAHAQRARKLPQAPQREAEEMLALLEIGPSTPLDEAVDKMVRWHRAFEAGEPPPQTGDVYRDLFLSKRGVCRHRSFSFMITANAAGIPTRYVTNEAHAFAEIWVPGREWIRVDLGGAAAELDISNASDKAMHRPRGEDPFPQPPEYRDNYTQLRGDIQGLSREQIEERRTPAGEPWPGSDPGTTPGTDPIVPGQRGEPLPRPLPAELAGKRATAISVDGVDASVIRGEGFHATGRLLAGGKGVAGQKVLVYLVPPGEPNQARLAGETMTVDDGSYEAALRLPQDVPLGTYEVYASTPGDRTYAPALSE